VQVDETSAGEYAEACGLFLDAVTDKQVHHLGTPELATAIRGASTKPLGDAWKWSRRASSADITPLVACTLAMWAAGQHGGGDIDLGLGEDSRLASRFRPSWAGSDDAATFPSAEERANLFAASGRPPTWLDVSGGPSLAGMRVSETTAMGMPAISAAVRLLCETIAQLPLNVYRGRAADKRLADWTWQYRLLGVLPGMGDFTPFDLISDIVACLELYGNAYLQKVKGPGASQARPRCSR
jgi:hypothetical protein